MSHRGDRYRFGGPLEADLFTSASGTPARRPVRISEASERFRGSVARCDETRQRVNASYTEQYTTRRLSVYAQKPRLRFVAEPDGSIKTNVSRENSLFKAESFGAILLAPVLTPPAGSPPLLAGPLNQASRLLRPDVRRIACNGRKRRRSPRGWPLWVTVFPL